MNVKRGTWTVSIHVLILWAVITVNAEKDSFCDLTIIHVNLIYVQKQKRKKSTKLLLGVAALRAVTQLHGFTTNSTICKRRYELNHFIPYTISKF
jgi:hypothetical protein